jgi:hypothetical protein
MANIKLKSLFEAKDFQARSKETGKLVHFKSKDAYQAAIKAGTHKDPKDKKDKGSKVSAKPNDMFGGDYAKDRGGEAPKKVNKPTDALPKEIYAKMDSRDSEAGEFNYLSTKDGGFMYGIAKEDDNYYVTLGTKDGDIIKSFGKTKDAGKAAEIFMKNLDMVKSKIKLDLGDTATTGGEAPKASVDGQTDDELYDALYDMGYDFGELGSDDFDENGFSDAAINLGYRWDDKNKVWNHRDAKNSSDAPKADTPKSNLPKKASQLKYKHAESLEKAINTETGLEGVADTDDNGAIVYNASNGSMPTYTLYMGSNIDYGNPDEFRVSLESTYANDPAELSGKVDKTFKSADEAMVFAIAVAKKYKKELEMDIDDDTNESTKLTSMIKR